jgi:hypothetical protein
MHAETLFWTKFAQLNGISEEMTEFVESFKSQALDELHTLSKIVKHNYPALLGQLSLENAQ